MADLLRPEVYAALLEKAPKMIGQEFSYAELKEAFGRLKQLHYDKFLEQVVGHLPTPALINLIEHLEENGLRQGKQNKTQKKG